VQQRENNPIIFALDVSSREAAERLVDELKFRVWGFKIGKEVFTRMGPEIVEMIRQHGGEVFLDLKYHDIPATVGSAATVATRLHVAMFNVHTLGGKDMLRRAADVSAEVAEKEGFERPRVLGVTVLTSLRDADLLEIGITRSVQEEVLHLAIMAKEAGLDGVVASPQEIDLIREACGSEFLIVTPGVRPKESAHHDQARVMTPREAIARGANYVVIGRPIRDAESPSMAAEAILGEIRGVA
jgi:orotidine-5'-phosphate decarboxylase